MTAGQRVIVVARWSSFLGEVGTVSSTNPHLMVRLDGEPRSMRFGEQEVVELTDPAHEPMWITPPVPRRPS